MQSSHVAIITALLFLSCIAVFSAVAADDEEILSLLQKRYDSISSISADFEQENYYKALKQREKSNGKVSLKKPGKMRWTYSAPVEDELVSDGVTLWYYQPDLAQAMEMDLASGPPAVVTGFLMGGAEFKKDFTVEKITKKKNSTTVKLKPRNEQKSFKSVTLELDNEYTVVKAVIEDSYGGETTVSLINMKLNKNIDDSIFRFKAPKGVAIIKQ